MSEELGHWRLAPFFEHRWMIEQSHQLWLSQEPQTPAIDWLALMQAQEAITQQRPWWNPFGIDWNIRQSPDWNGETKQ